MGVAILVKKNWSQALLALQALGSALGRAASWRGTGETHREDGDHVIPSCRLDLAPRLGGTSSLQALPSSRMRGFWSPALGPWAL